MPRYQSKKDVRTFLGMTGYYRRFIQDYATIAEPLVTELTSKNLPEIIVWNERAELAIVFRNLKMMLITAQLIKNPGFSGTFVLQTQSDASGVRV